MVFFGTGGSWPSPERNVVSIGIQLDDEILLFDCGEGTQRQIMKSNMSFMKIKKIFITHFHGDHFLGLPGLIQTMALNGRKDSLYIYGPKGTIDFMNALLNIGFYSLGFSIFLHELVEGDSVIEKDFSMSCVKANHPVPALSYSIVEKSEKRINKKKADSLGLKHRELEMLRKNGEIKKDDRLIKIDDVSQQSREGRKIVYSGDTKPFSEFIEFSKNADILIHESTVESSLEEKANKHGHSSARQAAEIAKNADVKKLFLVHLSARYKDSKIILDEAKNIFENVHVPKDLEEFIITVKK